MTSKQIIHLKAFAKVNLSLDITGVLENGYHLVETIMQSISLHDLITLTPNTENTDTMEITLTCSNPALCPVEKNTAYRAAKAFFLYCHAQPACITIHIKKNIPNGAGLAGGSADAAAVLHGLNHMYRTKLTLAQLCEIGATIGADVPFCICGGTMLATGIGDQLCALTPLTACFIVICKPPISVSTQKAYQKFDSAVILERPETRRICMALEQNDLITVAQNIKNVFEEALSISSVQSITSQMKQLGAIGACMTGSGSAALGIFSTKQQAAQCVVQLQTQFQDVFICEPTVHGVQLQKS